METHEIVLIPGFFGFETLGELRYWEGVPEALGPALRRHGIDAQIRSLPTMPTASIRRRAAKALEAISEAVHDTQGPVHVVGHSTGGLDARLAVAPTANLPTGETQRQVYERVESLVTVATPHRGTPLASFFAGAMGRPLLRTLALATTLLLERGRIPLQAAISLGALLTSLDDRLGLRKTTADEIYRQLLNDFSPERQEELATMMNDVAADTSLVFQLTPAAVDILNASTADPEGIRYGSVVTKAPRPGLRGLTRHGLDIYAQSLFAIFRALQLIVSNYQEVGEGAPTDPGADAYFEAAYGGTPEDHDNDGIVPTRSQVWGTLVHAARADHLDVVGHYASARGKSTDWLPSGSEFDDQAFQRLWDDVAAFIANVPAADPR